MGRLGRAATCAVVALGALTAGCLSTKPQKKSPLMKSSARVTYRYSAQELRLLMRDAVGPLTGRIEETADRITAETRDPAIRRAALLWKLEAMPAYREALFRTDPVAAMLDSYALTLQMERYYRDGAGRDAFGPWQSMALDTLDELHRRHVEFIDEIVSAGDPSSALALVEDWADDHPIQTSIASRPSIMNMAGSIKRKSGAGGGLVSGIGVTVDDMVRRIEVYSDQIPRQSRWQAELFTMDLMHDLDLEKNLDQLPLVVDSVDRVAATIEHLDARIDSELELVLADVDRQRLETLAFTAEQLQAVLAFVREERELVIAEVERERLATIEDLRAELRFAIDAVSDESSRVLGETDTLANRHVDHAFERTESLLNRLLLKVALGLAVLLVIGTIAAFVVVRTVRPTA